MKNVFVLTLHKEEKKENINVTTALKCFYEKQDAIDTMYRLLCAFQRFEKWMTDASTHTLIEKDVNTIIKEKISYVDENKNRMIVLTVEECFLE